MSNLTHFRKCSVEAESLILGLVNIFDPLGFKLLSTYKCVHGYINRVNIFRKSWSSLKRWTKPQLLAKSTERISALS